MNKLLNINLKNKYDIFNICSSKPVSLKKILDIFKKNNILPKLKYIFIFNRVILKMHLEIIKKLKKLLI